MVSFHSEIQVTKFKKIIKGSLQSELSNERVFKKDLDHVRRFKDCRNSIFWNTLTKSNGRSPVPDYVGRSFKICWKKILSIDVVILTHIRISGRSENLYHFSRLFWKYTKSAIISCFSLYNLGLWKTYGTLLLTKHYLQLLFWTSFPFL